MRSTLLLFRRRPCARRLPETYEEKLAQLEELRIQAVHSASEDAVEKQHAKGKLTARERSRSCSTRARSSELDTFVRHRTYEFEMDKKRPWGDAVVTGHGTIDGRPVCVFSQDFTVFGGSLGEVMAEKMCKIMDLAAKIGCPVIGINDSGGARIQEGVVSLGAYGDVFVRNVKCSGVIPQISVIMGPCAGGAVYSPAMTDFIFMVKETSHMFITGPDVIKTVTGEEPTFEELGGAMTHNTKSGVAHFAAENEEECLEDVALPHELPAAQQPREAAARRAGRRPGADGHGARHVVPDDPNKPYDMRDVVAPHRRRRRVLRGPRALRAEHHLRLLAAERPPGRHRRQPAAGAGRRARHRRVGEGARASCASATRSTSRCSRSATCRASCRAPTQEWGGIIRHGAKLLYAFTEATVPKLTVVTRKAYGGAYDVMSSKHMLADFNFAWPTRRSPSWAPRARSTSSTGATSRSRRLRTSAAQKLISDYKARFANPYTAAERGYIDDVIVPHETRPRLINALETLQTKRVERPKRKHGNIPL